MPRRADTASVRELLDAGAQLLEVLPAKEFRREHLPGARNIPLPDLTEASLAAAELDPTQPTVVYCYDHECDLSARGAALLEAFGFTQVYDYAASKTAWLGAGHPVEGSVRASSRAGALARPLPTCKMTQTTGELADRFGSDGLCAVTNEDEVVLGIVRQEVTALAATTPVRTVMQAGPPSVRPSILASELAESMDRDGRPYVLVTTFGGRLLGIVAQTDLHGQH